MKNLLHGISTKAVALVCVLSLGTIASTADAQYQRARHPTTPPTYQGPTRTIPGHSGQSFQQLRAAIRLIWKPYQRWQ